MRIAVCDDELADRKKLCTMLQLYCERQALYAEVFSFENGCELLRHLKRSPFNIIFLDIFLKEENGIELARAIRKISADCTIFFSTVSRDFALDGFEVNALHYLVKPYNYADIEKAMNRCHDKLVEQARTLILSPKQQTKVLVKDIFYVEAQSRLCHIHTPNGVEYTRKKIKDLDTELGTASFLRCHRSYIVNLAYVREYDDTDFILHNGMHVPIRQEGRSKIKRIFHNYLSMRIAEKI